PKAASERSATLKSWAGFWAAAAGRAMESSLIELSELSELRGLSGLSEQAGLTELGEPSCEMSESRAEGK
ncbi:hypothetical protein, partial [Streptomyces telluris]